MIQDIIQFQRTPRRQHHALKRPVSKITVEERAANAVTATPLPNLLYAPCTPSASTPSCQQWHAAMNAAIECASHSPRKHGDVLPLSDKACETYGHLLIKNLQPR